MLEMSSVLSYTGLAPCHEVSENSLKFVSINGTHNVSYFSFKCICSSWIVFVNFPL
jgi:hypothetical protein